MVLNRQRILFITGYATVEPLGIMYLSSIVKQYGHITDFYMHKDIRKTTDFIVRFNPTIVAVSITTGQHIELLKMISTIKDTFSYIKIVIGGAHVTYFPKVMNEDCIDFAIRGDADNSFLKLVNNINTTKEKDQSDFVVPTDLDMIPFPDRKLVYKYSIFMDNPVRNVMTSRGCPYSCSYCYATAYRELYKGQKIVRYRSPRNVIDECRELIDKYYTTMIFFADDEFSMNVERLKEIKKLYTREVNIPFHCQIRIDILTEDRIRLLKEMGCYSLTFAIESGNEEIRKKILNRNITNKQITDGCKLLKKYRIKFRAENMLGLPNETFNQMLETLRLNQKVTPNYAWTSIYQPFPNTVLGNYCKEQGLYNGNTSDIKMRFTEDSVLKMTERDRMILRNFQRLFSIIVKFPFLYSVFRIAILFNLTNFYTKLRDMYKRYCYKRIFVGVR